MELIVYIAAFATPVFVAAAFILSIRRRRNRRGPSSEPGRIGDEHAALALWWESRRPL